MPRRKSTSESGSLPHAGAPRPLSINSDPDDSVFGAVTDVQIEEYRDVFRIFDADQDGNISSTELIKILKSCGLEPTDEQVQMLIENVDTNGNGVIEFTEFCQLMIKYGTQKDDDLRDAFKVFDQDNNGYIDAAELQTILSNMGENLPMDQVEDMIREADLNGDGLIDYEEFIKMMTCNSVTEHDQNVVI